MISTVVSDKTDGVSITEYNKFVYVKISSNESLVLELCKLWHFANAPFGPLKIDWFDNQTIPIGMLLLLVLEFF